MTSPTPFTSTKVVSSGNYELIKFTSTITGTLVKVDTGQVDSVTIRQGTATGGYRVFDMVDNAGHLSTLTIQKVQATGFRRGFARVRNVDTVLIEDCIGIGDPTASDRGSVPGGWATSDLAVDNLIVRRCVFDKWVGTTASYTNGDGAATEELVKSLFEDVSCSHNADGGLDLKGLITILRALAEDNHRNFRFWGDVTASDLTSINPRNAHIWCGGGSRFKGGTIKKVTFIGGDTKPHVKLDSSSGPATLTIVDPTDADGNLIPRDKFRIDKEGGSQVTVDVTYSGATSGPGPVAKRPAPPNLGANPAPVPDPTPTPVPTDAQQLAAAKARLAQIAALVAKPLDTP